MYLQVSAAWVLADCAGSYAGSTLGSLAFDQLGFAAGTGIETAVLGGTCLLLAAYSLLWGRHQHKQPASLESSDSSESLV